MTLTERHKLVQSYLGKSVDVVIDRPVGYVHKKEKYTLVYKINYGYIPNVLGGDGEELDVYVLGMDTPIEKARVKIIGICYRKNDCEDKLAACPVDMSFTKEQIEAAVHFQEQYYDTYVECI